ncbi:MAG: DUF2461 domain-containing protein [Bacteroidetes bacterium]|nr:MAG: DUF2461 domain-containing protein [Bacteroidota bacterium]
MHPELDEMMFPPFDGFPREGFAFLRRLKKHNDRDWFLAHKEEYERLVKLPMQSYVAALRPLFSDAVPEFDVNPKRSLFRIYRDTRFSKDKTPYKTHSAAHFELKKHPKLFQGAGYYVHVAPGEVFIGGGIYMPENDQAKKIRAAIAADPEGFTAIVTERRFRKLFGGLQGERLSRPPKGFAPDHPLIDTLKFKQFFVGVEWKEETCHARAFLNRSMEVFIAATPLIRFLNKAMKVT